MDATHALRRAPSAIVRDWLSAASAGHCGATDFGETMDCSARAALKAKGNMQLRGRQLANLNTAAAVCLAQCASCESCRFISVSRTHGDCSLYASCDLQHTTGAQGFHSGPALRAEDALLARTLVPHTAALHSCAVASQPSRRTASTPALQQLRSLKVGAIGSSITVGAEASKGYAWPDLLGAQLGSHVRNGAVGSSSADLPVLCWNSLWGTDGRHPAFDLLVVEYSWTSSLDQMRTLLEMLNAKAQRTLAILYHHAPCDNPCGLPCSDNATLVAYERLFSELRVPFVTNHAAWALPRYGLTKGKSHPSDAGQQVIADAVARWVAKHSDELLHRRHRSAADDGPITDTTSATAPRNGARFHSTCHVGHHLEAFVVAGHGFHVVASSHKNGGLASEVAGSSLTLSVPLRRLRAGFVSVAVERSWAHEGVLLVDCLWPCVCTPVEVDLRSKLQYTFPERSSPRWFALVSSDAKNCSLALRVSVLRAGRVLVTGASFSEPLAGNRTVDTRSLDGLRFLSGLA